MESPTVLSAIVNAGCTLFIQIKESLMYVEHPDFQLRDRGLKISRYFSLHKFTDLLQSKQAYFARADQFRDQSEGVWSKAEVEYKLASCATRQRYEVTAATERISEQSLKSVAINCWCIGDHEWAHMWGNFIDGTDGIAISTTVQDLIDAFDGETIQPLYVGEVTYIDYETDRMGAHSGLAPFVFKSKEFAAEREIRAVTTSFIPNHDHRVNTSEPAYFPGAIIDGKGIRVSVHLNKLIKCIRIAPFASSKCVELVHALVSYYLPERLHAIQQSRLYSRRRLIA